MILRPLLTAAVVLSVVTTTPALADTVLSRGQAASLAAAPATPVAGARNADLTIIEYLDYNCPYCKLTYPELKALLKSDPKVRVIYKDWPIFGPVSRYAAEVALAAGWQGRYLQVHAAFLQSHARISDRGQVRELAKAAGVDLKRLDRDLAAHAQAIAATLERNDREARSLGLQGTPGLVIGRLMVPGGMPLASLQRLVTQQRRSR